MKRLKANSSILAIAIFIIGCSSEYVFRNDDRPTYDNTVNANELAALKEKGARVIDVRLLEDFEASPKFIPDAMYRDPESIETWAASMSPTDEPVVVYCVKGKWVSQKAANYLKDKGFDVYSLEGGIQGWEAAGLETTSTP